MPANETIELPALGEHGAPCPRCGAALSADQRYCLNCGSRRAEARVPFREHLSDGAGGNGQAPPAAPPAGAAPAPRQAREWAPLAAIGALAALGVMFVLGVLIGKDSGGEGATQPLVLQGGAAGSGAAETAGTGDGGGSQTVADTGTIKDEWPAGKTGWTVELGTLPKGGTTAADVEAAKADAAGKGAPGVGVLDSDSYGSLPPGKWVLYSGVYDSKGEATKALGKLGKDFPDAAVVKVAKGGAGGGGAGGGGITTDSVDELTSDEAKKSNAPVTASDDALKDLQNQTGDEYQDTIKKLPDTIKTEGKPAPTDDKPPAGGDTDATVIG